MNEISDIRPSPIVGQWYAGDAARLAEQVDGYMQSAEIPSLDGEVVAVVAPHAGHIYSGPVAGYAFAALRGLTPDVVAVISPMHQPYFESLLTTSHGAYTTPLGNIPVDREAVDQLDAMLEEELGVGLARVARDQEHSLEIELPFLQRALDAPFRLLPLMLRDQGSRVAQALGYALARLVAVDGALENQKMIMVASTDLSHFYSESAAASLDQEILRQVEAFDPDGVIRTEEQGKGFACGRGALAAVLWAAQELGADQARVLHYDTSASVTGDYQRVVGYASAVITRPSAEL